MSKVELTEKQRDAMLKIGNPAPDAPDPIIAEEVIEQLVKLDLLYYRAPDHLDLTDLGESVYDDLAKESGQTRAWSKRRSGE